MKRLTDIRWLRATGARLDWAAIVDDRRRRSHGDDKPPTGRDIDLRLVWACAPELGLPREPFQVWTRQAGFKPKGVAFRQEPVVGGLALSWGGGAAASVSVVCEPMQPNAPVGLFAQRFEMTPEASLAAVAQVPTAGAPTVLTVSAGAISSVVLHNARPRSVAVALLDEIVNDPGWELLEIVGMPDDGQLLAGYALDKQGLANALTDPLTAALQRLDRAAPPIGWWALAPSGRAAPPWSQADFKALLKQVRTEHLPMFASLFDRGRPEDAQSRLATVHQVQPPSQGGRKAAVSAQAIVGPFAALNLAALTDPLLNLALGLGTGWPLQGRDGLANADFLITARYGQTAVGQDVEIAAFVPRPAPHTMLAMPDDVQLARAALTPPSARDAPWRESLRLDWLPSRSVAVLPGASQAAFAACDPGTSDPLQARMPKRVGGGLQPLVVAPARPDPDRPGSERVGLVDPDLDLPIVGAVARGRAVAVGDVFGLWSPWVERDAGGRAPEPEPPRLVDCRFDAIWSGTPSCAGTVTVDVALRWIERAPLALDVVGVCWPMPTATTRPPAGAAPTGPVPLGCRRLQARVDFVGDEPSAGDPGTVVEALDGEGKVIAGPIGGRQPDAARRYRLRIDVPGLDFSGVGRWGVQLWVRATLRVHPGPTAWSPSDPLRPAIAVVASPVPVVPLPPPQPPGVPLGSLPDAQGLSHVRVAWGALASPPAHKVIVWETSESILLERLDTAGDGQPDRATQSPGERLARLWTVYDATPADRRREVFTRLLETDPTTGMVDVALPKGSRDIHLFIVTAIDTAGLESPWPAGHTHLQAAIAPRVVTATVPQLRVGARASPPLAQLEVASPVEVASFELFATRSELAARSELTMGPPVARLPASAAPATGPLTGDPVYGAQQALALTPSWEPWLIRAVAVPLSVAAVDGVRGRRSAGSDVVTLLRTPETPPTLGPLAARLLAGDGRRVRVTASTDLPPRVGPCGSHRARGLIDGVASAWQALDELALVEPSGTSALPATDPAAPCRLGRGQRASGQTPLVLDLDRADPSRAIDVALEVVDALGRLAQARLTVPGIAPPGLSTRLNWSTVVTRAGAGTVFAVVSDVPVSVTPSWKLGIDVSSASGTMSGSFDIARIPTKLPRAKGRIRAIRSIIGRPMTEFQLHVPLNAFTGARVTITAPDGRSVAIRWPKR